MPLGHQTLDIFGFLTESGLVQQTTWQKTAGNQLFSTNSDLLPC